MIGRLPSASGFWSIVFATPVYAMLSLVVYIYFLTLQYLRITEESLQCCGTASPSLTRARAHTTHTHAYTHTSMHMHSHIHTWTLITHMRIYTHKINMHNTPIQMHIQHAHIHTLTRIHTLHTHMRIHTKYV